MNKKNSPCFSRRKPCFLSNSPCFFIKKPCLLSKKPCLLSNSPCFLRERLGDPDCESFIPYSCQKKKLAPPTTPVSIS